MGFSGSKDIGLLGLPCFKHGYTWLAMGKCFHQNLGFHIVSRFWVNYNDRTLFSRFAWFNPWVFIGNHPLLWPQDFTQPILPWGYLRFLGTVFNWDQGWVQHIWCSKNENNGTRGG
jgi:hypothetical protein